MKPLTLDVKRDSKSPLYTQVSEAICGAIMDGRLLAMEKLPTQAEMARRLKLNALTIGRGYDELEKRGVIVQKRGSGSYVSPRAHEVLGIPDRRALRNVAFIFPQGSRGPDQTRFNVIEMDLLSGISSVLDEAHVNLCYFPFEANGEPLSDKERSRLASFDGLIINLGASRKTEDLVLECRRLDLPCVILEYPSPLSGIPSVTYDRRKAAYLAAAHLIDCGYRRIAYVGAFTGTSAEQKMAGFFRALREAGLDLEARFSLDVGTLPGRAYAEVAKRIADRQLPDAFFADTEDKALEVLHALQEHGLKVPEEIGVCGYDDLRHTEVSGPPLTTVYTPRSEMGQRAAEMLLHWPKEGSGPESVVLEPEMRVRGTTRKPAEPEK